MGQLSISNIVSKYIFNAQFASGVGGSTFDFHAWTKQLDFPPYSKNTAKSLQFSQIGPSFYCHIRQQKFCHLAYLHSWPSHNVFSHTSQIPILAKDPFSPYILPEIHRLYVLLWVSTNYTSSVGNSEGMELKVIQQNTSLAISHWKSLHLSHQLQAAQSQAIV